MKSHINIEVMRCIFMPQVKVEQHTAWEKLQLSMFSSKIARFFCYLCLILWSLSTIAPLVWVVINSFKTSSEVINDSFSLATDPTLANYIEAFSLLNIGQSYLNSFIMSGGTVFFTLLFGGLAAYALSRFRFRLRSTIQGLLVLSLLIPSFGTVIPVYEILIQLGLINTYWALIIPHTAGFLPFAVLVISGYMSTIPAEMEEAALIDGCSRLGIFTKIILPISKPSFATAGIFVFLWSYNDLFTSLIFVNYEGIKPIVVLLSFISSQYGTDYGLMTTAVTLTVIPVIIVYLFTQKYIEKSITDGAIKG